MWSIIILHQKKISYLTCKESAFSSARTVIHVTLIQPCFQFPFNNNRRSIRVLMTEGLHADCRMPREKWFGKTWHDRDTSEDTATTLMSRRFMSCWSAERKPWLILGKTIWAGVWSQEVVGQRWEKVEEGWGPRRRRRRRKANAKRNRFC